MKGKQKVLLLVAYLVHQAIIETYAELYLIERQIIVFSKNCIMFNSKKDIFMFLCKNIVHQNIVFSAIITFREMS